MTPPPFITLDHITVRLRDRRLLPDTCWQIRRGENWVIWGPNGAGKSTLARVLTGEAPVVQGAVIRHYLDHPQWCAGRRPLSLISGEQYHHLYERERLLGDFRHFAGNVHETTRAAELLENESPPENTATARRRHVIDLLGLTPLLDKPLTALSSGELRKMLLGRALAADSSLMILDEPFNALDAESRIQLACLLEGMAAEGTQLVLITHRLSEIPACFGKVLQLDGGRQVWQGDRSAFLARVASNDPPSATARPPAPADRPEPDVPPLIRMRKVSVRFDSQTVLDNVDWSVYPDQHWAVIGPNGAGKSTLLELITGDQLQAYANDITLFGRPRGSGETVWEIKRFIGHVGDVLQARYQRRTTGFDVVCSGFFDSVGMYRYCSDEQRRTARQCITRLKIGDLAEQPMTQLSFGQQRILLIARAMVKSPRLLILDEPCDGLDRHHRRRVLALLERIGREGGTQLLYVSHRPADIPACITHRLHLDRGKVVRREP